MTSTAASPVRRDPTPSFTPPTKLRRHPSVLIGGAFAIVLGAIIAAWAWSASTHTEEVLAARGTIHRGEVITAGDITTVRVSRDRNVTPVPASALNDVVGRRAALDIAAGSLLTPAETTDQEIPPAGRSIVGISLTAAQLPATPIHGGAAVRIVATPSTGAGSPAGTPAATVAQVLDTHADDATGNTIVDVLVPYGDASVLAARAATGEVALILDPAETGGR